MTFQHSTQAASDLAFPAARQALAEADVNPADLDLVIVATATPDMLFPATAALIADELGAHKAAAYDLLAGCTGFMYAVAQAYGIAFTPIVFLVDREGQLVGKSIGVRQWTGDKGRALLRHLLAR